MSKQQPETMPAYTGIKQCQDKQLQLLALRNKSGLLHGCKIDSFGQRMQQAIAYYGQFTQLTALLQQLGLQRTGVSDADKQADVAAALTKVQADKQLQQSMVSFKQETKLKQVLASKASLYEKNIQFQAQEKQRYAEHATQCGERLGEQKLSCLHAQIQAANSDDKNKL